MRWWLGAAIVYLVLISSALAFALYQQPRTPLWGVVAHTNMPLVWFNPMHPEVAVFASSNGTIVQFGDVAYWLPVNVRSACGLGDTVVLSGSINGSPALVKVTPGNTSALIIGVKGYLTSVSCTEGLSAAGVATGFISPPYRPILIVNGSAIELNDTVPFGPVSVYGGGNATYVSFGANYYLVLNGSGVIMFYAPRYVSIYYSAPGLIAGGLAVNASELPFLTVLANHRTYVMSANGYVDVAQPDLNGWALYLRPVAGWALLVYMTKSGTITATSAVLDYTFSLTSAYPYMGGVEVTGVYYKGSGMEQVGLYVNGTAEGYLEEDGRVIGWVSSHRPSTIVPSIKEERTPFSLTPVKAPYTEVPVREESLQLRLRTPVKMTPVVINSTSYNSALALSIDASLLATVIIIFVRRT